MTQKNQPIIPRKITALPNNIYYPKTSRKSAFTLLEVLVAIAILSMIFTMVYSILFSTLSARDIIHDQTHVDRMADKLLGLIIRDLQAVYIYQVDGPCFVGKTGMQGDRLDFVTNMDSLIGKEEVKSDLCEVSYYTIPNNKESGAYFLIRREDFFLDDKLQEGGFGIKLYDRVAKFKLEYMKPDGNALTEWSIQDKKCLPRAIRVTLGLFSAPPQADSEIKASSIRTYQAVVPVIVSPFVPLPAKKKTEKKQGQNEEQPK